MAHVLVVDDDALVRGCLQQTLERGGHTVVTAPCAAEAWPILSAEHFDCILSDLMMPGEDGLTFLSRALAAGRGIQGILITGTPHLTAAKIEAQHAGVAAVIPKPFRIHEVLNTVDSVLSVPGTRLR